MKLIYSFITILCAFTLITAESTAQVTSPSPTILHNQQLTANQPTPPIPPKSRNVSFISRWVIYGTFFSQFMLQHDNPKFRKKLNQAWDREINSIVNSTLFKQSLTPEELNTLAKLLREYKELGKKYINKILTSHKPNGFKNLLKDWQQQGQAIAFFFQINEFDPFNELPKWFEKATHNLASEVQALAKNDLTTEKPGFFAEYGASIRNFEEIGFTLAPTPCLQE